MFAEENRVAPKPKDCQEEMLRRRTQKSFGLFRFPDYAFKVFKLLRFWCCGSHKNYFYYAPKKLINIFFFVFVVFFAQFEASV